MECWNLAWGIFSITLLACDNVRREVAQLCPTLCSPMDCNPPGSSVHGIFQAWILEWVAISFSRWSSQPRDRTQVSRTADRRLTIWATREALAWEVSAIVWCFEHYLALPFFGIGMKTDLFQSCGHCWVFQICWHIKCSAFKIWKSSTGIPSPPLAFFIVLFPKAHLTSHSKMSSSSWVITPWLSVSWRYFLYSFVYSCHLFLISPASVRYILFLSFVVPIFAWNVPLVSIIFLKRSLVLPIILFFSISLHCSLKKSFLYLFTIL